MSNDNTRDLLVRGIAAAKSGDKNEARFYLEWLLRLNPPLLQRIDAWFWLSEVQTDEQAQRGYLEQILVMDPAEGRARRKLAILDGKLDPTEIVDPDQLNTAPQTDVRSSSIERFTCPQCGGRMTYTANGQSFSCEFCETRQLLSNPLSSSERVPESDFHVALATKRGHSQSLWSHAVTCQGCSAVLILEPGQLTQTCPYCSTSYALDQVEDYEIVSPDGILPLQLTEEQAGSIFSAWLLSELPDVTTRMISFQFAYLPVWTFDLGGQVFWNCQVKKDRQWIPLDGQEIVYFNDLPIFATRSLPEELLQILDRYDLSKMVDFDRRYLTGIKAQNYQISAADASLHARKIALDHQRRQVLSRIDSQISSFRMDSSKMIVESFRLVLIPAGLVLFEIEDQRYQGLISGQSGAVAAQKPVPKKKSFFNRLFD
jgi:uncharacterized CHY-type Zn-finger protein